MSETPLKVLILEDQPTDAELMRRAIEREDIRAVTTRVETEAAFRDALARFDPNIILSDFSMPHFNGLKALEIAHQSCPDIPFIFVSGTLGDERAVQTLRHGASDYVLKDNLSRLGTAVRRALLESAERIGHRNTERELRNAERRFRLFMQHLPGIASIKDLRGTYRFANQAWAQLAGVTQEQAQGRTDAEIWPSDLAERWRAGDRQALEQNHTVECTEYVVHADHAQYWLLTRFPIMDESGQTVLLGTIGLDVSGQKRQEKKIARLTRIHSVLSGINSTIIRVHERHRLASEACRIAVEHGGFTLAWIGLLEGNRMLPQCVFGPVNLERLREVASGGIERRQFDAWVGKSPVISNDLLAAPAHPFTTDLPRQLGYRAAALLPLNVDDAPAGVFALYADEAGVFDDEEVRLLSELAGDISFALSYIAKEERLNNLAYYDALTGLPNRSLFKDRLTQAINAARQENSRAAVILLDIDHFRRINDSYGRAAGDLLLQRLAARLPQHFPPPNTVARLEADTFATFLASPAEASDVAHILNEQVLGAMQQPIAVNDDRLHLTMRAGIAIFPNDGTDSDRLLHNAETALRRAHETGEPSLFYAPELQARATLSLALETRLRRALQARQFEFYYQPKVALATGQVSALEALLRWRDPDADSELVLPGEFIGQLEASGLIVAVGRALLARAADDYRAWLAAGAAAVPVAINVSAVQLRQRDFIQQIETFLAAVPGLRFDLEITESVFMQDIDDSCRKLAAVKERGIGMVAIDDFGTGYSSLSYLSKLPVDALKIDRSFIVDMTKNADSLTMVSTIISLGHALNMKIIAEGVETREQANLLKLLRCDEVQGDLFSVPLNSEQVAALLKGNGPHILQPAREPA